MEQFSHDEKIEDQVVVKVRGSMIKINDQVYIYYKEFLDKSTSISMIKFNYSTDISRVNITRHGEVNSKLIFEKGTKHYCPYYVEGGSLLFGVYTDVVNVDYSDEKCEINLKYSIDLNSRLINVNRIHLIAEKIKKKVESKKIEVKRKSES
ncbi:MAG: DUF1934 domain-containing protein [Acutalibacteraceae bacterium]